MGTTAPGCSVIEELVSVDITIDDSSADGTQGDSIQLTITDECI